VLITHLLVKFIDRRTEKSKITNSDLRIIVKRNSWPYCWATSGRGKPLSNFVHRI